MPILCKLIPLFTVLKDRLKHPEDEGQQQQEPNLPAIFQLQLQLQPERNQKKIQTPIGINYQQEGEETSSESTSTQQPKEKKTRRSRRIKSAINSTANKA